MTLNTLYSLAIDCDVTLILFIEASTAFMYAVKIWKSYVGPKHPLILPHLVFYPNLSHIYH